MICPYYKNKEVFNGFNEMVEAFGGKPLTEEEFKSSELRNLRTGLDYSAMEAAYKCYHRNNGNMLDLAPNGEPSVLFKTYLNMFNGDRSRALIEKSKVYSNAFINWFGDWINDPSNASKVVDLNGEPLVVYHGGAKDIEVFKHSTKDNTTTGTGYYTDKRTGEKIPVDSENAMFFSSNPYVATSYASLYGIQYFQYLHAQVRDMLMNSSVESGLQFSRLVFKNGINDIYRFFDQASEFNPRFKKLKDYVQRLLLEGKKLTKESERTEVIKLLKELYKKLDDYTSEWLMNRSEWEYVYNRAIKLIDEYNNKDGIRRLLNGEIPETIKKEWKLYKKLEKHREREGKPQIANYETLTLTLGEGRYYLEYDGKELKLWTPDYSDPKLSDLTEEELSDFLTAAKSSSKYGLKLLKQDEPYQRVKDKAQEYGVFLNIRNPFSHDYEGTHQGLGYKESSKYPFGYVAARLVKKAIENGNDGVLYQNIYDPYLADNYGVFNSNQIKSATDNNGNYSTTDDSIYKSKQGEKKRQRSKEVISKHQQHLNAVNQLLRQRGYTSDDYTLSKYGMSHIDDIIELVKNYQDVMFTYEGDQYKLDKYSAERSLREVLFKGKSFVTFDEIMDYLAKESIGYPQDVLNVIGNILRASKNTKGITMVMNFNLKEAAHYDYLSNTIRINPRAIFRNDSRTNNAAVQTIMHELVHAVTVETLKNSSILRKEAQELLDQVKDALGDDAKYYGLSNIYEFLAELTSEDFVKKLTLILVQHKSQTLLQRINQFFSNLINRILNKYHGVKDNAYVEAVALLQKIAIPSYNSDSLIDYSVDEETGNIFNSKQAEEAESLHDKLLDNYKRLFNTYKKMPNKSVGTLKIQDDIWRTMYDIKTQERSLVSGIVLDQALARCGSVMINPNSTSKSDKYIKAAKTTMLGYLQAMRGFSEDEDVETEKLYPQLTPELVDDMYKNCISFYELVLKDLQENSSLLSADDIVKLQLLTNSINEIKRLWREAVVATGDRTVNELVDRMLVRSNEEKDAIKAVAKDYLHRNEMYGDLGKFSSFLFTFQRQDSPIIKQAFQLIQEANMLVQKESLAVHTRLTKLYNEATTAMLSIMPGNWLTMLMERYTTGPKKGLFTGYFASPVNRGQYKYDLERFKEKLDQEWIDKYGYTYVTDKITGEVVNSVSNEPVANQNWDQGMPNYYKYQLKLEKWLCEHSERRYTFDYYAERMSEPYDPKTRKGHGLSPRTMVLLNNIQLNINYILLKCTDIETGIVHPEKLQPADQAKLNMWRNSLDQLSNPFNSDGSRKTGDDLQTALELQAWNQFVFDNTDNQIDWKTFNNEVNELYAKVQSGEIPIQQFNNFLINNAQWAINPEVLRLIFGECSKSQRAKLAAMFNNAGKRLVKTNGGYLNKDFSDIIFNENLDGTLSIPEVWYWARQADIINEEEGNDRSKEEAKWIAKTFKLYFSKIEVPYRDGNGNMINRLTGAIARTNKEPLLTWYDYILKKYTDAALEGKLREFKIGGKVIVDFTSFNGDKDKIDEAIRTKILGFLSFHRTSTGMEVELRPISLLSAITPRVQKYNGMYIETNVPRGRFNIKTNKSQGLTLINDKYDIHDYNGVQPNKDLYGNEDFYKIKGKAKEFYDELIDTMSEHWQMYGMDPSYNRYKLPQVEGDKAMVMSRILNSTGQIKSSVANVLNNAMNVTSDDFDMRSNDELVQINGKWVADTVPTRFVNDLEHPENVSSDLVSTVTWFANSAINYKEKTRILPILNIYKYNLASENRSSEFKTTGKRQESTYNEMLQRLFFENNSLRIGNKAEGKQNAAEIATTKAFKKLESLSSLQLLALGFTTMATGFLDSTLRVPVDAMSGKYFDFKTYAKAVIKTIPEVLKATLHMQDNIARCKAVAMMEKDFISTKLKETASELNKSRGRRILGKLLMGGYTILDYITNMVIQRAVYDYRHFYDDPFSNIRAGFYSKPELIRLFKEQGMSKKEAISAWRNSDATLWDAYLFTDGRAVLKPEYEYIVTKATENRAATTVKQRAALINGVTPTNDTCIAKGNFVLSIIFIMRNFLIRQLEHLFAGGKFDNVVRKKVENIEYEHRGSKTYAKHKTKWLPFSEEDRYIGASIDYATGEDEPEVLFNLVRTLRDSCKICLQMLKSCSFNHKTKFNNNEKAAIRDTMAYIASTILLMFSYMPLHNFTVRDTYDLRPTTYEETVPSIENYLNQHLYYKQADLVLFRVIESRLTNIDPNTTLNFVHSASASLGAIDDWYYIFGGLGDLTGISGHDLDEEVKTGKYTYSTRGQRAIRHAIGPLDNIWSSFTYYGLDYSLRYYFNQYGYLFRAFGYDGSIDAILNGEEDMSDDSAAASPAPDVPEVEVPEVEVPEVDAPEVSF